AALQQICYSLDNLVTRDQNFLTRCHFLYLHLWPFVAIKKRDCSAFVLSGLELARNLLRGEWIRDPITLIAKLLNLLERVATALLLGNNDVDIDRIFISYRGFHFFPSCRPIAKQFAQNDIAHRETKGRHGNRAVAELF